MNTNTYLISAYHFMMCLAGIAAPLVVAEAAFEATTYIETLLFCLFFALVCVGSHKFFSDAIHDFRDYRRRKR